MKRARRRTRLIAIVLLTAIAVIAALCLNLEANLGVLNASWQSQALIQSDKRETYRELTESFGYGGFIHHFKNYVIRRDDHYLAAAGIDIENTRQALQRYRQFTVTDAEREALDALSATLDEYYEKFSFLASNQLDTVTVNDLDAQVKVDDTAAFEGLRVLSKLLVDSTQQTMSEIDSGIQDARSHVISILLTMLAAMAGFGIVIWSLAKRLEHSFTGLRTVFDAVPDALIQADSKGRITEFNQKATEIFGYSSKELECMTIEDLLPEMIREAHRQQREEFTESERKAAMGDRNLDLCAKRKNGEVFPVDISLGTFQHDLEKKAIVVLRDIWERKAMERELSGDYLTKLPTRRALISYLQDEVQRSRKIDTVFSVMLCDIDNFREINEKFDFQTGDEILIDIANLLKNSVRKIDILGRWDGEEFLVLCPHTGLHGAELLAEQLRKRVEDHPVQRGLRLTVSISLTEYSLDEQNIVDAIESLRVPLEKKSPDAYNRIWVVDH